MISSYDYSSDSYFFLFFKLTATGFWAALGAGFFTTSYSLLSDSSFAGFKGFFATTAFFGFTYSSSELGSLALIGFFALGLSTEPFLAAGAGVSSSTEAFDPFLGALTTFFFSWTGVSSSLYYFWGAGFWAGLPLDWAWTIGAFCFFLLANSGSGLLY